MAGSLVPRAHFPAADEVTYLNAASIALSPQVVREHVQEFERTVGGRGTVGFDDEAEARAYEGARAAGARLFGCTAADVAVTTSATEALNQVAWWLRPGEGENVVSIDIDFPSVTYVWKRLARDTGVEVRLTDVLRDPGSLTFGSIEELVDVHTRVICVSHVQYGTGFRFDLRALADLAHAHDAVLVIDATQSAGMLPLDVDRDDVDVMVAGSYKWLCAAFGAALCYVRPALAERFLPPFVGWRSTVNPPDFDAVNMLLAPGVRAMEYSTVAYGSGMALGGAVEYLLNVGIEGIFQHDLRLAQRLVVGLRELGGRFISPIADGPTTSIVGVRFPGKDARELHRHLSKADVFTSLRLHAVRFSPHLYNDDADIDRALEIVERVVVS
jgi:selenocysteine lyase/cysteine desulfurase